MCACIESGHLVPEYSKNLLSYEMNFIILLTGFIIFYFYQFLAVV